MNLRKEFNRILSKYILCIIEMIFNQNPSNNLLLLFLKHFYMYIHNYNKEVKLKC